MKVVYDIPAMQYNIQRAKDLLSKNVVLMFKTFYEHLADRLPKSLTQNCWSIGLPDSICSTIGKAGDNHIGTIVVSCKQAEKCLIQYGIDQFFIPVDCNDEREGLSLENAKALADELHHAFRKYQSADVYAMITSGCLNSHAPKRSELDVIWDTLSASGVIGITLGGSYWIGRGELPEYITNVRIGEYMLFGTIPYSNDLSKFGKPAIFVETQVLAIYPERGEIIVDCGYKLADLSQSKCQSASPMKFVDSSSEYSIFRCNVSDFKVGDKIRFIPNYKSLVTLKDGEREYIK